MFLFRQPSMPTSDRALPGRPEPIVKPGAHFVTGRPLAGPFPEGSREALFALGCFWGAEKDLWEVPGVWLRLRLCVKGNYFAAHRIALYEVRHVRARSLGAIALGSRQNDAQRREARVKEISFGPTRRDSSP